MTHELAQQLVPILFGFVTGMAGTIFLQAKDASYIKGQLGELVKAVEAFRRVAEHVATLDKSHYNVRIDLARVESKVDQIERDMHDSSLS